MPMSLLIIHPHTLRCPVSFTLRTFSGIGGKLPNKSFLVISMYVDNRQVPYRQQKCVSSIHHQYNDCVLSRIFEVNIFRTSGDFNIPTIFVPNFTNLLKSFYDFYALSKVSFGILHILLCKSIVSLTRLF